MRRLRGAAAWIAVGALVFGRVEPVAGDSGGGGGPADLIARAERFVRGVYACDPAAVDELAAENIVISYPIFEQVFGTPVLRGRDAVRDFAAGFCQRWADPEITIDEAIADGDRVVLMWTFRGWNVGSRPGAPPPTREVHAWGGFTLYRFDEAGKIVVEVGEESDPGPAARLAAGDAGDAGEAGETSEPSPAPPSPSGE